MSRVDDLIRGEQLAFAMKAFALRPGERLEPWPYVRYILWHLDKVASGKVKRVVVALPPRHGKTFLCSISFAAWILAHNPAAKILIISYGQELADKIAYDIRAILQCEWYRRIFIKTRLKKSKLDDLVTTAGGGVRSVSLEGGVTGLGADFIIIDDAVQIKDADNDKQLERVNALFDAEIRTRLNNQKKGAIVIVAHRLAENDLPGHVLAEGGWKLVKLPLIAPRARTYETDDGLVWQRRKGELLRPDAFTTRDIGRLRRMKRPDFETLQQQNPGERDRLRVKAEHIGVFRPEDVPPDAAVVLSIDPGQKGGPSNSCHVVQAWVSREGRHFLVDQWRDRCAYRDFRTEVYGFIRRWRPSAILIEATGNGLALLSDIRPQLGMQVVPITPVDDKVTRLRRHLKTIRGGAVCVPKFAPWLEIFVAELTAFPYGEFDDQVDALSQYLDWIAENPCLVKRPPRAVAAGISGHGMPLVVQPALWSVSQTRGAVLVRRRMR
jgi:predicted phage terminase large subunit-like protein